MALAMTSRRPTISAESGIKWRSGKEGAIIKLCTHHKRRYGEDLRRILKILLIQSQAQFSDPYAHKLLPEFSHMNSFFKPNSPSAHDPVESVYRQSESESPELVCQELWSNGEKRYEPCLPTLTWPDPVHRCSQLPCPICKKR